MTISDHLSEEQLLDYMWNLYESQTTKEWIETHLADCEICISNFKRLRVKKFMAHTDECAQCGNALQRIEACFGHNFRGTEAGFFAEHHENCLSCQTLFQEINDHYGKEISGDLIVRIFRKADNEKATLWADEPYEARQVFAAWAKVPVEVCLRCPYFDPVIGGGLNAHGQPGSCQYCRAGGNLNNLTGRALCED